MKRLTVILMGMLFLLGMALVPGSFAQAPSGDAGKALTPAQAECPPGQWDANYGRCKQPTKGEAADTKATTPAQAECPPGQWDANYGRCKQPTKGAAADTKALTPAQGDCPPYKWDANYGRCKQ